MGEREEVDWCEGAEEETVIVREEACLVEQG